MKNKKQMTVITTKIHKTMKINKVMARKMGISIVNVTGTLIRNINNDFCNYSFIFSGKDRNLNIVELLCANCSRWFHESCIGYQLGKLVPFLGNYVFVCKNCSPTGLESFRKNQARMYCSQSS